MIGDIFPNEFCDVLLSPFRSGDGLNVTLIRDKRFPTDAKLRNFGVDAFIRVDVFTEIDVFIGVDVFIGIHVFIAVDVFIGAEVILLVLILKGSFGLEFRDLTVYGKHFLPVTLRSN